MSNSSYVFTSESVSSGHPDKICDLISDSLVDKYISQDSKAKTAIETVVTKDLVVLVGEVNSTAPVAKERRETIVRDCIKEVGYDQEGFSWKTCEIRDYIHSQSPDIAMGVEQKSGVIGAGDQGMMIGYATDETDVLMPAPIYYSHRILEAIEKDRKKGVLKGLGVDAKVQLSIRYKDHEPCGITSIVLSTQHEEELTQADVRSLVMPYIENQLPDGWICPEDDIHINPTGKFVIGGPVGDSGLTGRKIIVDTYGSAASHGGGAFSGKDPTKVDRSGAYMARYIAKNIVAAGLAKRCTVQIAYGIGLAQPLSIFIDTHGTGFVNEGILADFITKTVDLTPRGIIETLDLRRPIYKHTSTYGHFGRSPDGLDRLFPWEKTDMIDSLKSQ